MDQSGNVEGFTKRVNGDILPPAIKVYDIETANVKKGQYAEFGWHLLENKRIDEAVELLLFGKVKEPADIATSINLAHCYLFKNEYDKAIQLYEDCLNQKSNDPSSLKNTIYQSFDFFSKTGMIKF